jgi:hypothetical protein
VKPRKANLRRSTTRRNPRCGSPPCLLRNKCADCKVVVVSSIFYYFFSYPFSHCS